MKTGPERGFRVALACAALLFFVVYGPTLAWLLGRWSMGHWYRSHEFLVLPLAAWLGWRALRGCADRPPSHSAWGFALLVPALLLVVVDSVLHFGVLAAWSLVLALPGISLLLLGRVRTRALWFPFLFVAVAVPVPFVVAKKVHLLLRNIAAVGTEWSLDVAGFDVVREGTLLAFDGYTVQVADACSGFTTLMALLAFSLLIAYHSTTRLWRGALLVALVFPFAVLVNILRCFGLCVLVAGTGVDILESWVHPAFGLGAFVAALLLLLLTAELVEPAREEAAP